MEFLQLKYFCSAAELENFTLAAKRHMIPQSTVSITIKRLEKELGKQLFNRNGNQVELNDMGREFYIHAKRCLAEYHNAKNCVSSQNVDEVRLLILEERSLMADLICKFNKKYPHVRFSVCHNLFDHPELLYDIRITSSFDRNKDCISRGFLTEKFVLAVSTQHPLATRECVNLEELANENFISYPSSYSGYRLLVEACAKKGFVPSSTIVCSEQDCKIKYVAANLGVAVVPYSNWKQHTDEGIVLIPLEDSFPLRETRIECLNSSYSSDAVRLFVNFCLQNAPLYEKQRNS